jgi:hypothetical protein
MVVNNLLQKHFHKNLAINIYCFLFIFILFIFIYVSFVEADAFDGPSCYDPENLCKPVDIRYKIFLPQNLKDNYYILKQTSLYLGISRFDIITNLSHMVYLKRGFLRGRFCGMTECINFIKKSDLDKISFLSYPESISFVFDGYGLENCIVLDTDLEYKLWQKWSEATYMKSEEELAKMSEIEYYKEQLNKEGKKFMSCDEFDKKLIKIKFAKPEDSDKSVLEELAKQLGVYGKENYALGYIPKISPIEAIEIEYKADPEVKDGYITLTKLRATIYLDDGTKKELKSSSLPTTSTNVITPTTSFQSIPAQTKSSQSLLLNLWLKIKCFFLRLIGKAC